MHAATSEAKTHKKYAEQQAETCSEHDPPAVLRFLLAKQVRGSPQGWHGHAENAK